MFPNQDTTFISFKISIAILQVSSIVMEALKLTTEASKNRDPELTPVTFTDPICGKKNCLSDFSKVKKNKIIIKNLLNGNSSIKTVMGKKSVRSYKPQQCVLLIEVGCFFEASSFNPRLSIAELRGFRTCL